MAEGENQASRWLEQLDRGAILFREGDVDRRVFVLIQGRVEILKEDRRVAVIDVAESFIGEVAALTGRPRWGTVRTVEPSTMLVVDEIGDFFEAEPEWGLKLARVLASRLDRMNERFSRLNDLLEETRDRLGSGEDERLTQELRRADLDHV